MKPDLQNMTLPEIEGFLLSLGEKKFRGGQIFSWLARNAASYAEMTDLPAGLRETLGEKSRLCMPEILRVQTSSDGTRKYLLGMEDGQGVESVFMQYHHGNSVCLSSQAGCSMGCAFCASTIGGLKRNLTAGEMIGQLSTMARHTGLPVSNVVVMGTGEPFANYEELARFIEILHHPKGRNLSLRSLTVSTCGLVPGIQRLGEDFPQVNLAVSLHAPNDEIRSRLMPVNKKYPMKELLEACRRHSEKTGRRVTFEYALIQGVNSQAAHAEELAGRLRGKLFHVNLIPLNPVSETGWQGVSREQALSFQAILEKKGVPVTLRRELGRDIDAACGQLRLRAGR